MYRFKSYLLLAVVSTGLIFSGCKKKEEATNSNIATEVVQNLGVISANYTPDSLSSASSSSLSAQSNDPCAGVTDFAVCQSNLIREYIRIGKDSVDAISSLASQLGGALGQIPDGNSGTSIDGKVSWNKTSEKVWSIISRNASNATIAYFSVNNGVYTLKIDENNADAGPLDRQIEATITYNSEADWSVDVYFGNGVCDAAKPTDPSKAHIKMSKTAGLWNGKAMLYVPRWQTPGGSAPTCATTAGSNDIAMYTEFVGNDVSTKAALYLIPSTEASVGNITNANFSLPQFCTQFASACGNGPGQV
ncbi:MAG: hypothetical protein K2X74_03030, partial [Acetobacteraceae bacterium]|nr:hypothetical protein [Acetobacteraceae bacterium]MBY0453176.1 hypothetical protein [Pseudobdellovibrionaceae bacterium]